MLCTDVSCNRLDSKLPDPPPFIPTHYNLELKPDIYANNEDLFSFSGHVAIYFRCKIASSNLTINSADLTVVIHSFAVVSGTRKVPKILSVRLQFCTQIYKVSKAVLLTFFLA